MPNAHNEHQATTENVLLDIKGGPYVVEVDRQATRFRVAGSEGVPPTLRGLSFERSGRIDSYLGLPLFRPVPRQL